VLCAVDQMQEPDTIFYGFRMEMGAVRPGSGLVNWAPIALFMPSTLMPPRGGRRRLQVRAVLCDESDAPVMHSGQLVRGRAFAQLVETITLEFAEGYLDASEKRKKAEALIVRLAMALTMLDGEAREEEIQMIKKWVSKRLELVDKGERTARRDEFNRVIRAAYEDSQQGRLDVFRVTSELDGVADQAMRVSAVELSLGVVTRSGVPGTSGLELARQISNRLGVDGEKFKSLRDKAIPDVSFEDAQGVDFYDLFDIDRSWSKDRIRVHLNQQYDKWNARAEAFEDPAKRAHAEKMLELVAQARRQLLA
jgi:hypothetical protein